MTPLERPVVRCDECGHELTVVAMTSDGSRAVCPCGRTTATTHNVLVDRDPGDEQPDDDREGEL